MTLLEGRLILFGRGRLYLGGLGRSGSDFWGSWFGFKRILKGRCLGEFCVVCSIIGFCPKVWKSFSSGRFVSDGAKTLNGGCFWKSCSPCSESLCPYPWKDWGSDCGKSWSLWKFGDCPLAGEDGEKSWKSWNCPPEGGLEKSWNFEKSWNWDCPGELGNCGGWGISGPEFDWKLCCPLWGKCWNWGWFSKCLQCQQYLQADYEFQR